MTPEKAKEVTEKAQLYKGGPVTFNKKTSDGYQKVECIFKDFGTSVWKLHTDRPVVSAFALLEEIETRETHYVGLEELIREIDSSNFLMQPIQFKEVVVTLHGQSSTIYVGAVPCLNKGTHEPGYLAYSFKVSDGVPSDYKKGREISRKFYKDSKEAISEGEKIVKEQIRQTSKRK